MLQEKKPIVLLIEADMSLRRLIVLGLQHRGMEVIALEEPTSAYAVHIVHAVHKTPDLLIIDIDSGIRSDWSLLSSIQSMPALAAAPTIVLAWERLPIVHTSSVATAHTQLLCLTKPFDARIMHQSIDHLLATRESKEAALLAQAEAVLLATYKQQTPPSIWPIVTAIGLLIAFVGMMLHVALIILGLLIVLVALLWWTLGTKPSSLAGA